MKRAWIGLLLFLLVPAALGQKKVPRREDDRVIYDYARLLDAEAKESILKIIWPLFKAKRPIVVLTINKLADWDATPEQVHEFSTLVYNRWAVGSRTTDNMGALIVVAKDDRKMSLIVGEGITGYRQEQAAPIINDVMGPNFKDGDFAGGIREGAIAIRDRIFQPKASEDLSALPYETPPKNAAGDGGSAPSSGGTGGAPGDIGLPGPGNPNSGDPGSGVPGGTPPRPRPRDDRDQAPPGRSGPGFPGTNLHFNCGRWFCIAIGALVLLSLFRRRRQPTYGYGPQSGPPPPGYQHQNYQRGGGLGGMLGGILTGMLINSGGRRSSGGGGSFGGGGGGGSVFGDGGGSSSGGSFGGGGSSGSWGGGGGGGGGGFGGGSSSGGGASGSW